MDEAHQHRSTDAHGNPDDRFTEQEALKAAEAQGITFIDFWLVISSTNMMSVDGVEYESRSLAEKAKDAREDSQGLTIAQGRKQAPSSVQNSL